jgi:hypothetical protein
LKNVTAVLSQGQLVLTGDAQANQVQVSTPLVGLVEVTGLTGTTINGGGPVSFRNVRDIIVKLKAGNDSLTLDQATLSRDVIYKAGAGTDNLVGDTSFVGRNLKFIGSLGDDSSVLTNMTIGGSLRYVVGEGFANQIQTIANTRVLGNFSLVSEGAFTETLLPTSLIVHGKTVLKTAGGNDVVNIRNSLFLDTFFARTGSGNDGVFIEPVGNFGATIFGGTFDLNTGADDDNVILGALVPNPSSVRFRTQATLNGGSGTNNLSDINSIKEEPAKFSAINFT